MKKAIKPNYDKSQLSIVSSLKKYFNEDYPYESNAKLDELLETKRFNHIVFMIIDGMGTKVLKDNLEESSFLLKHHVDDLISVFPSTTAAVTTSAITGLPPLESGWTGWENYIKELNEDIVLFTGERYFGEGRIASTGFDLIPVQSFWKNFPVFTQSLQPTLSEEGYKNMKGGYTQLQKTFKSHSGSFTYFYCTEPDSTMHAFGCNSRESHSILSDINNNLEGFVREMPNDVLIIVSADHGHTNVEEIDLYKDRELYSMLKRNPANEGRAISFSVKEECLNKFETYFNSKYRDNFKLYKSKEAINIGLFGDPKRSKKHHRIDDFLGDYFAVAIGDKYFSYVSPDKRFPFKSHHAGMTKDEMIIPLIVIHK